MINPKSILSRLGLSRLLTGGLTGALVLGAALSCGGCHGDIYVEDRVGHGPAYYDDTVYVRDCPPPDRVEVLTPCPGPEFVWIDGCWTWQGRWVWSRGYWMHRPRANAVWVHSTWVHDERRGYGYHRGYWTR